MNIIHLTDLDHHGVQPYARLTEAPLRNRLEPDKGIFICESPKVIRVALDAGYQPLSLLTEEKFLDTQAADIIARHPDMPVYTGSRELLASLTGPAAHRRRIACPPPTPRGACGQRGEQHQHRCHLPRRCRPRH